MRVTLLLGADTSRPRVGDEAGFFFRGRQMLKAHYRRVEYAVHSTDECEWSWDAYPTRDTGLPPMHGTLKGSMGDAMRQCLVAIDRALDDRI